MQPVRRGRQCSTDQPQARAQDRQPLAGDRTRAAVKDDHQLAFGRLATDNDCARPSDRIERFLDHSINDRLGFRAEVLDAFEGDGHLGEATIARFGSQRLQRCLETGLEYWGSEADGE